MTLGRYKLMSTQPRLKMRTEQTSNSTKVQLGQPIRLLSLVTNVYVRVYFQSFDDSKQMHHKTAQTNMDNSGTLKSRGSLYDLQAA